jgi:hypothetical protein
MSATSTDPGSASFIDLGAGWETMHPHSQSRARYKTQKKYAGRSGRIVPAYDELSLRPQSAVTLAFLSNRRACDGSGRLRQ